MNYTVKHTATQTIVHVDAPDGSGFSYAFVTNNKRSAADLAAALTTASGEEYEVAKIDAAPSR